MSLPGVVTNVTGFGAFVDIGVHQDGLVHISELSERYVKEPADVVRVHQRVEVTVLDVDLKKEEDLPLHEKEAGIGLFFFDVDVKEKDLSQRKRGGNRPSFPRRGSSSPSKRGGNRASSPERSRGVKDLS